MEIRADTDKWTQLCKDLALFADNNPVCNTCAFVNTEHKVRFFYGENPYVRFASDLHAICQSNFRDRHSLVEKIEEFLSQLPATTQFNSNSRLDLLRHSLFHINIRSDSGKLDCVANIISERASKERKAIQDFKQTFSPVEELIESTDEPPEDHVKGPERTCKRTRRRQKRKRSNNS